MQNVGQMQYKQEVRSSWIDLGELVLQYVQNEYYNYTATLFSRKLQLKALAAVVWRLNNVLHCMQQG